MLFMSPNCFLFLLLFSFVFLTFHVATSSVLKSKLINTTYNLVRNYVLAQCFFETNQTVPELLSPEIFNEMLRKFVK